MNSLRPELLELTPQALTALSNAGFVKRSQGTGKWQRPGNQSRERRFNRHLQ